MGNAALMARRFEAIRAFAALLAETLIAWLGGELSIPRDRLIEDCADLFVATGESAVALARSR
jgi:hypothetical protein